MEVLGALPLAVAAASQALPRGGLVRQSKSAVGLCSLTLACFFFSCPSFIVMGLWSPAS